MANMLRAFRHRNYNLFFGGQSVSLIGTWIQTIAMSWLVYQLTGKNTILGVVTLVGQVPAFLISPFAGVWLDHWDRRKILIGTQTFSLIQALILAVLVFTHTIQVWHILLLSVMMGVITAFDTPGRQAFLIKMVPDRDDLGNAIAMNSLQFNMARVLGPPVAAFLMKAIGIAQCFFLNAFSYVAVIIALLAIRVPKDEKRRRSRVWQDLKEGYQYSRGFMPVKYLLLQLAAMSFAYGMYSVLMPAYAVKVFHIAENGIGLQGGAIGLGALISAVFLISRSSIRGMATLMAYASFVYGVALVLFAFSSNVIGSAACLVLAGYGVMTGTSATNILLQNMLEDHLRGRVMAFYAMSFVGAMPLGSFVGGYMGDHLGLQLTTVTAGGCAILATLIFYLRLPAFRMHARPVLQQKGALPSPTGE